MTSIQETLSVLEELTLEFQNKTNELESIKKLKYYKNVMEMERKKKNMEIKQMIQGK
jgi:hypothetical protein